MSEISAKIQWLDDLIAHLKAETVWLPAKIEQDGRIRNADVGTVIKSGPKTYRLFDAKTSRYITTGKSHFNKQQLPVNKYLQKQHIQDNGTSLGTYLMNQEFDIDRPETRDGAVYLDDNPDARILKYGQTIRRYKVDKGLRNFINAAQEARKILLQMKEQNAPQHTGDTL